MRVSRTQAIALIAAAALSGCALLRDERGAACQLMDEPIVAQFPMTHAQDYQLHLPHMGRSPELEHDALAFVVAFAGPIEMGVMRAPDPIDANGNPVPGAPRSNELNGVVCVVVNGSPTYYSGVDITGWN